MAVSKTPRRKLLTRGKGDHPLTPLKFQVLKAVQVCYVSIPEQIADYCGISVKAAGNHLFDLFHEPIAAVNRMAVDRSALAGIDVLGDPALLGGRAPTIYSLNKKGAKILTELGLMGKDEFKDPPEYGPGRDWGLAHELQVRDLLVWFKKLEREYPDHIGVSMWRHRGDAWIGPVKPDGIIVYKLHHADKPKGVVCLVEADRNTERTQERIIEKFYQYAYLFQTNLIEELTGYARARVIFTTPNAKRRDTIAGIIGALMKENDIERDRFWCVQRNSLETVSLTEDIWRVPGREVLMPFMAQNVV